MVVLAPVATASVRTVAMLNAGARRNMRRA